MNAILSSFLKALDRQNKFEVGVSPEIVKRQPSGKFQSTIESVESLEKSLEQEFGSKLQPIKKEPIPYKPVYQFKRERGLNVNSISDMIYEI